MDVEEPSNSIREPVVLDPEHPLLEKFQKALKEHLLSQIDHVKEELFQYETSTKSNNVLREELGVQTYEAQQMVCKQQKTLESMITDLKNVTAAREEIETALGEQKAKLKEEREKLFLAEKEDLELQNEIGSMNLLIHLLSQWEEKVESDIIVNQRVSEKSRKDNLRLSEEKRVQDLTMHKLSREIHKLQGEIETMNLQLQVKEYDLEEMSKTVVMGNTNIDALQAEYRCLMHSWNSVVIAIGNRDKVLDCIKMEDNKQLEKLKNIWCEIEQVKKLTKKEMNLNEKLTKLKSRLEFDIKICKVQVDEELKKQETAEQTMKTSGKNIFQTQKDSERENIELQNIQAAFAVIDKHVVKLSNEKRDLEDKIIKVLENQITNDKGAMHLHKILYNIRSVNSNLEITVAEAENKLQNFKTEIHSVKFDNEENRKILQELEKEYQDLGDELKQMEIGIVQQELVIRAKERSMETLNLKVEKIVVDGTLMVSPMELRITELEKVIEEMQERITKLQSYWLREQRNLIYVSKERQEQIHNSNLIKKQILIMDHKNLKINGDIDNFKKDERRILRQITYLQNKIGQLCVSLFKRKDCSTGLQQKTNIIGILSECKLKDAELKCLQIESSISEIEEEKLNLSKELIDLNREALEWEKKVILAKETKDEMRGEKSLGGEVDRMKQEIHRMNVRYSQLRKAQDKLIHDLDHCVSRRDAIYMESEARQKRIKGSEEKFRINFTRKMDDTRNKIKQLENEIEVVLNNIEALELEKLSIREKISAVKGETEEYKQRMIALDEGLEMAKTGRQLKFELLLLNQKKLSMYTDLSRGRVPYTVYKSEPQLTSEYNKQKDIHNKLSMIVENLSSDFPNHANELNRIYNTLKVTMFMALN